MYHADLSSGGIRIKIKFFGTASYPVERKKSRVCGSFRL